MQPSVLWLSIVTLNHDAKSHRQSEFCTNLMYHESDRSRPVTPPWNVYMAKFEPGWEGYPVWHDRATRLGGSPHLSCKREQIKIRDYMDRRVTPRTWGPPPPCKQALKHSKLNGLKPAMSWNYHITYKHKIKCARANGLNSSYRPEKDTTSLHVS